MATDWKKVEQICEDEAAKAHLSIAHHLTPAQRARKTPENAAREHDEFLAMALVFERIGGMCQWLDEKVLPERIAALRNAPDRSNLSIEVADEFPVQWAAAFDYALKQCGLEGVIPFR